MSKADWDEFRRKALAPRVRGPAWRPCNPNVALASYFPVVERGATPLRKRTTADWERAYVLSVRAAEYILEQLRPKHPAGMHPQAPCDRMVQVLAVRSIKRAELCEAHIRNGLRMARKAEAKAKASGRPA